MAVNERRRWVIAYDLRDPRRIARLHRFLKELAVPVQYSVFAAVGSPAQMQALARQIEGMIDPKADDVRLYALPQNSIAFTIGRTLLPADAQLTDAETRLHALLQRSADPGRQRRREGVS